MKEKPILFSGAMVRAILEGRKTQTRRVVKPQPTFDGYWWSDGNGYHCNNERDFFESLRFFAKSSFQTGNRLWVREAWRPAVTHHCNYPGGVCDCDDVNIAYPADGDVKYFNYRDVPSEWLIPKAASQGNVPSIHMPRWASRITLEITSVRVERLQEISEVDAKGEGVSIDGFGNPGGPMRIHQRAFKSLWQSINGPKSWEQNPWVWVVEFKRV